MRKAGSFLTSVQFSLVPTDVLTICFDDWIDSDEKILTLNVSPGRFEIFGRPDRGYLMTEKLGLIEYCHGPNLFVVIEEGL